MHSVSGDTEVVRKLARQMNLHILDQQTKKACAFDDIRLKIRVARGWLSYLIQVARPKRSQTYLAQTFMLRAQRKSAIRTWRIMAESRRKENLQYAQAEQHLEFQARPRVRLNQSLPIPLFVIRTVSLNFTEMFIRLEGVASVSVANDFNKPNEGSCRQAL